MAFLQRLSDSFWAYVSPRKTNEQLRTPSTARSARSHAGRGRRLSLRDITRNHMRSMSPAERVGNWNDTSLVSSGLRNPGAGRKRKRLLTPDTSGVGRGKKSSMEDVDMDDGEMDFEYGRVGLDIELEGGGAHGHQNGPMDLLEDVSEITSIVSELNFAGSATPKLQPSPKSPRDYLYDPSSDIDVDETTVVDDAAYHNTPKRRKILSLPAEQVALGISTNAFTDAGWSDDHITFVQKIKLRGHEPLLPKHWQYPFRFMPDALFAPTDEAFISSVQGSHFAAEKAFEKLLDLGSRIRDANRTDSRVRPEFHVRTALQEYLKWAQRDSGLDARTTIPILALEIHPEGTKFEAMQASACKHLAQLASRYRAAFQIPVLPSTEASPSSRTSTLYAHPVPQLYTIMASKTIVAILAYRPETPGRTEPVAVFDFGDVNCDVWNSIALAITVCHARNVQMGVADETGLGVGVAADDLLVGEDMDI